MSNPDRTSTLTRMFALALEAFCERNRLPPGTITVTPQGDGHRVTIDVVIPSEMSIGEEI